MKNMKYA